MSPLKKHIIKEKKSKSKEEKQNLKEYKKKNKERFTIICLKKRKKN